MNWQHPFPRLALRGLGLVAGLALAACAAGGGTQPGPTAQAAAAQPAPPQATLHIYKSDGSRQCEPGSGLSPADMQAQQLQGIRVLAAGQGELRGVAFPAVCGGMTGRVNVFRITEADWPQAQARGFQRWAGD